MPLGQSLDQAWASSFAHFKLSVLKFESKKLQLQHLNLFLSVLCIGQLHVSIRCGCVQALQLVIHNTSRIRCK